MVNLLHNSLYFGRVDSQLNDLVYKMFMQLYSPYRGHTKQYGTMVLKHLRNQLDKNIRMVLFFSFSFSSFSLSHLDL